MVEPRQAAGAGRRAGDAERLIRRLPGAAEIARAGPPLAAAGQVPSSPDGEYRSRDAADRRQVGCHQGGGNAAWPVRMRARFLSRQSHAGHADGRRPAGEDWLACPRPDSSNRQTRTRPMQRGTVVSEAGRVGWMSSWGLPSGGRLDLQKLGQDPCNRARRCRRQDGLGGRQAGARPRAGGSIYKTRTRPMQPGAVMPRAGSVGWMSGWPLASGGRLRSPNSNKTHATGRGGAEGGIGGWISGWPLASGGRRGSPNADKTHAAPATGRLSRWWRGGAEGGMRGGAYRAAPPWPAPPHRL